MTTLLTKPVSRETTLRHRGRVLIVTMQPFDLLDLRHKGTRTTYSLPLAACYDLAVKMEVAHKRAEKAKARKAKKQGART